MVLTRLNALFRNSYGVALIEFAIVFPFLFVLLFGGIEVTRFIRIQQKVEKSGYVLVDIESQYPPATNPVAANQISEAELTANVFPQFSRMMGTFADDSRQAVVMTSVQKTGGALKVKWQMWGGGTLSGCDNLAINTCVKSIVNDAAPSRPTPDVGVLNQSATFNAGIQSTLASMAEGDNLLVGEVFYYYQPILQQLLQGVGSASSGAAGFQFFLQPKIYVKRTYFAPRNGALIYLPPHFPAP